MIKPRRREKSYLCFSKWRDKYMYITIKKSVKRLGTVHVNTKTISIYKKNNNYQEAV